jgi:hypothetical protein
MSNHSDRSYEPLTKDDLTKLANSVIGVLKKKRKLIENIKCIVISQNTAVHYLDPNKCGLHDFDVIVFFDKLENETHQRPIKGESELKKFGNYCKQCKGVRYKTRKMDIFCKRIKVQENNDICGAVKKYFVDAKYNKWIKIISERPCIGIYPEEICGKTLWKGK